jgi:hypothetical protein
MTKKLSEFTKEEHEELAKAIAREYIAFEKIMIQKMIDDIITPFWVKWYRQLKAKFKR